MAGLIPQQFIDDLLTRIDIVDVIDDYLNLRKAGRNHQALCPFHDEKTPSFTVSQQKQFYHCFGCGANGTAITFLMEYSGLDFVTAVEELAGRAGVEVPREGGSPAKDLHHSQLYELNELVVGYYRRQLREHAAARSAVAYLKGRGIDGKVAAEYELGFSPPGWDSLINTLGKSNDSIKRLSEIGVVISRDSGGYYDRFRNRIIFPIRDQRGRAIGLGGRVIDPADAPKYLNSPETAIFHKGRELYGLYQARQKQRNLDHIYIVEGYMDVLALAQHDISNSVATLGTAVTEEHIERLFKVCPQLIFCFDGDSAGQKAAWRAMETALPHLREGRQVFFIFMPEGKDPDDMVRESGPGFLTDSSQRIALSAYLLETLKADIDMSSLEGRALLAERAIPHFAKIPPSALQSILITDLARQCQLGEDAIKELLRERQPSPAELKKRLRHARVMPERPPENPISRAIQLLLHQPGIPIEAQALSRLKQLNDPGVAFLVELIEFLRDKSGANTASILEHWRDTRYQKRLQELAIQENPLSEHEQSDIEAFKKQFMDYISLIEKAITREQRQMQTRNIKDMDDLRRLYQPGYDSDKDDP